LPKKTIIKTEKISKKEKSKEGKKAQGNVIPPEGSGAEGSK
jgi:hypothetical protein